MYALENKRSYEFKIRNSQIVTQLNDNLSASAKTFNQFLNLRIDVNYATIRAQRMREELPRNQDVVFEQQTGKLKRDQKNARRSGVSRAWVITWYSLALIACCLWLLRLLGVVSL